MSFSENLVRRRKTLGLSQEELASRVQVSRQAVSKWETGDAMPDLSKLLALADALDISLDVLCGRETPSAPASAAAPPCPKNHWLRPALCAILVVCLLIVSGAWAWSQRDIVPAEEAAAQSTLPDTFTVSGVQFSGHGNRVDYQFVPSISGPDYTYQIVFTDSTGSSRVFDAEYVSGVCSGSAAIAPYDSFQVTVTVSDGNNSRSVAVALALTYSVGHASWQPLP